MEHNTGAREVHPAEEIIDSLSECGSGSASGHWQAPGLLGPIPPEHTRPAPGVIDSLATEPTRRPPGGLDTLLGQPLAAQLLLAPDGVLAPPTAPQPFITAIKQLPPLPRAPLPTAAAEQPPPPPTTPPPPTPGVLPHDQQQFNLTARPQNQHLKQQVSLTPGLASHWRPNCHLHH